MTRRAAIVAGAFAAVLALAAGLYSGAVRRAADPASRADAATLLALTLPDATGKEEPLAQWRGKLLIVNFWATWCAPCREEMPEFVRAQREFGARGLQFVGIAVDESAKVRQFADEIGLNYPALVGGYGAMELSRTLGNQFMALPFTIVVGPDGTIVHTELGPLNNEKLLLIIGKFI